MARLAIKGHATRGKEVIELLEMLGGKNSDVSGKNIYAVYSIPNNGYIYPYLYAHKKYPDDFIIFTLEEFLEKYPYKVGDKVKLDYWPCTIQSMEWDEYKNTILYIVRGFDFCKCVYSEDLQPYKEETMEERENSIVVNNEYKQLKVHSLRFDKTQLMINDEYELKQEGNAYYIIRRKLQYPRTYVECAKILNCFGAVHIDGYKCELLEKFQELLICRDAYWKIAGEQVGLGEPWRPDYIEGVVNTYYTIHLFNNKLFRAGTSHRNAILSFPTEEMRDAFYENFKDLIEACKELL